MRNNIALILLCLSWPVNIIHRYWNNSPEIKVSWIILDKGVSQDFRWYWVYNELWVSSVFVLIAFMLCKQRTKSINIIIWSLLIISGIDIVNYWLWFRRNELCLFAEGLVLLSGLIIILKNKSK